MIRPAADVAAPPVVPHVPHVPQTSKAPLPAGSPNPAEISFATRLLAGGVDVRTVAGRLGHRNPNVTLNVYAHFLPEADREAADLLGAMLPSQAAPAGGPWT